MGIGEIAEDNHERASGKHGQRYGRTNRCAI
ncbi:MAG: hypothetical protein ACI89X_002390 [Planctomycetota bacterium]